MHTSADNLSLGVDDHAGAELHERGHDNAVDGRVIADGDVAPAVERVRRKRGEEEGKKRKGKRVYCCHLPLLSFFLLFIFPSLLSFFPLFALFSLADATGVMSYVVFQT